MTSKSASSAPAALMACKIEITSRAVAPMLCNPPTNSSILAPSPISRRFAGLSLACTSVWPTTSVFPAESGAGWETESSVWICTENPPCKMDTAPSRTSFPITMVLDASQHCRQVLDAGCARIDFHASAVAGARDRVSEFAVDGVGDFAVADQGIFPHPFDARQIADFDGHRFARKDKDRSAKRKQQETGGPSGFHKNEAPRNPVNSGWRAVSGAAAAPRPKSRLCP